MKTIPHVQEVRAFNRFYTGIIGLLNGYLQQSKYSLPEMRIIYELHHGRNLRAQDIMLLLNIDKSYLSRLLKKLQKDGIVSRKRSAQDARAFTLALTEKGNEIFNKINAASNAQIGTLLNTLSESEKDTLVLCMKQITQLLHPSLKK